MTKYCQTEHAKYNKSPISLWPHSVKSDCAIFNIFHGYKTIGTISGIQSRQWLRSASSSSLIVGHTRLGLSTVRDRTFPVAAARIWNNLPQNVTAAPSLLVFRSRLKTHLFTISYPSFLPCTVPLHIFVILDTLIVHYLLTYLQYHNSLWVLKCMCNFQLQYFTLVMFLHYREIYHWQKPVYRMSLKLSYNCEPLCRTEYVYIQYCKDFAKWTTFWYTVHISIMSICSWTGLHAHRIKVK